MPILGPSRAHPSGRTVIAWTELLAMQDVAETGFAGTLRALARPAAFPFPVGGDEQITIIQTHASAVLLAGDRAYKLKKPLDLGFLDYSTPALRRRCCAEEVRLNARLAPRVYLGVAPVLADGAGVPRFGPTCPPDDVPEPGARLDGFRVVDYAVVMRRLPEEATLAARVRAGAVDPALLVAVARRLAAFHGAGDTGGHVERYGSLDVIRRNWEENLVQMLPYAGRALAPAAFGRIAAYARGYLEAHPALFAARVREGRIRDCHGDLRPQHVYVLDGPPGATEEERLAIIDCIEFNERFRYGDGAGEVAFLAMELDAEGRPDLARAFVDGYVAAMGDEALRELLPFYCCYRACVRGKVLAFEADEPEIPHGEREVAKGRAGAFFRLAAHYAAGPTRPRLLLVGGLMGTGKSTLAATLRSELGWPAYSSDAARKRLVAREVATPDASAFGSGIYTPDWTACTYAALLDEARAALAAGRSAILDATFARRADRLAATRLAAAHGADCVFLECACPRAMALDRLARRWASRVARHQPAGGPSAASDGRPELYDAQCAAWELYDAAAEPGIARRLVVTVCPLAESISSALDGLGVPRLACWLATGSPSPDVR